MKKFLLISVFLIFSFNINAQSLGLYSIGVSNPSDINKFEQYSFGVLSEIGFQSGDIVFCLDGGIISVNKETSLVPIRLRGDYLLGRNIFVGLGIGVDHYNNNNVTKTNFSFEPSVGLVMNTGYDFNIVLRPSYGLDGSSLTNKFKIQLGIRSK